MRQSVEQLTEVLIERWKAGTEYEDCEDARSAMASIEWMVRELGDIPHSLMELGQALSAWKNGSKYTDFS